MRFSAIATALFCVLPLAHASITSLISNGDFEAGSTAFWTATTGAPYMDVTGSCNDGFAAQTSASGCTTGNNPAFGSYAAYSSTTFPAISNNVGEWDNFLSQSFIVPLGPIDSATLSFEYTITWGGTLIGFHGINVEANILSGINYIGQVALLINPNSVSGSTTNIGWTLSTTDVTSLLQSYQGQFLTLQLESIGFYDTRGSGNSGTSTLITGFDNVQLNVESTPEPSTVWLAAGGLFAVVLLRRRLVA